jgi:hypothetical protein
MFCVVIFFSCTRGERVLLQHSLFKLQITMVAVLCKYWDGQGQQDILLQFNRGVKMQNIHYCNFYTLDDADCNRFSSPDQPTDAERYPYFKLVI